MSRDVSFGKKGGGKNKSVTVLPRSERLEIMRKKGLDPKKATGLPKTRV